MTHSDKVALPALGEWRDIGLTSSRFIMKLSGGLIATGSGGLEPRKGYRPDRSVEETERALKRIEQRHEAQAKKRDTK